MLACLMNVSILKAVDPGFALLAERLVLELGYSHFIILFSGHINPSDILEIIRGLRRI